MAQHLPRTRTAPSQPGDRHRPAPGSDARVETIRRDPRDTATLADEVVGAIARLLGRQAARNGFGRRGEMPTTRTKAKAANQAAAAAKPNCRRLFSIHQAADFAGVPVQWIYNWIETRRLEAYVLAGGIRIDEVEVADCISSLAPKQP